MLAFALLFSAVLVRGDVISDFLNNGTIKEILTGAADACNNTFVSGPYIEGVLCGGLIPPQYLMQLTSLLGVNLQFTPAGPLCQALACAYRLMGCADPTYRVEAQIIQATGSVQDCGADLGIDPQLCTDLIAHIASPPSKRGINVADKQLEAMLVAREAIEDGLPEIARSIDWKDAPQRKRQGSALSALASQLQLCSPLVNLGITALVGQFNLNLPINLTTLLGPCGLVCNYALCGANLLCMNQAATALTFVNSERTSGAAGATCSPLTCASFVKAPANQCMGVTCNNAAGQYLPGHFSSTSNCQPPAVIVPATRTSPTTCCETCVNPCMNVQCTTTISNCFTGTWPFCYDAQLAKNSPTDCCAECVDPCFSFNLQNNASIAAGKGSLCPQVNSNCGPGQVLGPGHPGSCCAECVAPCEGVACTNQPTSQANCPAGTHFVARATTPTTCAQCCNTCAAGAPLQTQVGQIMGAASTRALAAAASLVALLVALLL